MQKRILAAVWITLLLTSFVYAGAGSDLAGIVTAKFNAMNKHDTGAIAQLYADSASVESPNWQGAIKGPAAVRDAYARYFQSSPDLRYSITNLVVGRTSVVVEYTSEGTIEHNEEGVPEYMRGKHYVLKNITRMDIADGRIVAEATYFDQVSFLRQMGFFEQPNNNQKN